MPVGGGRTRRPGGTRNADKRIIRRQRAAHGRRLRAIAALLSQQPAAGAAQVSHRLLMMPLRLGNARQQQQTVRRIIRAQSTRQLRRPFAIPRRECDINSPAARILRRRIAGHQIVIDDTGLFVHFAALIEPRHSEHQIGILRVVLHRAHQLVIRCRVVALLAQMVRFVNHITVANTGQLRRRTACLQLRVSEQTLRFGCQARLVKYRHLIGIIPGIT